MANARPSAIPAIAAHRGGAAGDAFLRKVVFMLDNRLADSRAEFCPLAPGAAGPGLARA